MASPVGAVSPSGDDHRVDAISLAPHGCALRQVKPFGAGAA
jgi:hypothetical protein